jgi:hypothetical protein
MLHNIKQILMQIIHLLFVTLLMIILDATLAVNVNTGDVASLIYLWNPWAIVTCVGSCTSTIENLMVVIMIYGACSRKKYPIFVSIIIFKYKDIFSQLLTFLLEVCALLFC